MTPVSTSALSDFRPDGKVTGQALNQPFVLDHQFIPLFQFAVLQRTLENASGYAIGYHCYFCSIRSFCLNITQKIRVFRLRSAPKEKFGEYMGFSKLSGKVSASLGPLIWAAVILLTEPPFYWQTKSAISLAVAVMGIIMVVGLVIILFVKPKKTILEEDGVVAK